MKPNLQKRVMVTEWQFRAVNVFLESLKNSGKADEECGTPLKVVIDWKDKKILFDGPKKGKVISMHDIFEVFNER